MNHRSPSVWTSSQLCSEAEQAEAAREQEKAEQAKRTRRFNTRIWKRNDVRTGRCIIDGCERNWAGQ